MSHVTDFIPGPSRRKYKNCCGASFASAEMLAERVAGKSRRVADLTKLIASCLAEKYTIAAPEKADFRGGLPVRQLRKVEEYLHAHLADDISLESLAELAELSPFHFSGVFKQTTGMSPLQLPRANGSRAPSNSSAKPSAA